MTINWEERSLFHFAPRSQMDGTRYYISFDLNYLLINFIISNGTSIHTSSLRSIPFWPTTLVLTHSWDGRRAVDSKSRDKSACFIREGWGARIASLTPFYKIQSTNKPLIDFDIQQRNSIKRFYARDNPDQSIDWQYFRSVGSGIRWKPASL